MLQHTYQLHLKLPILRFSYYHCSLTRLNSEANKEDAVVHVVVEVKMHLIKLLLHL
jgi:hypothetical protein